MKSLKAEQQLKQWNLKLQLGASRREREDSAFLLLLPSFISRLERGVSFVANRGALRN